jgi:glyoxylate reductase
VGPPPVALVTRRPSGCSLAPLEEVATVEVWEGDGPMPAERVRASVAVVDGLLSMLFDRVDAALVDSAPRLRAISQMAVGVDNIDLTACTLRGIPVGYTPDVLTDTTADTAIGLLLAAARRLVEGARMVAAGEWRRWDPDLLLGHDLHHTVLGVVGMGRIGRAVGRRAIGFGMDVVYAGPNPRPEAEMELGARRLSLQELLSVADHVVITAPLTAETRHLINRDALRAMKPSAVLVNVARGGLVDQMALAEALDAGIIAAAGLDVTDPEPIDPDDALLGMSNCIIVPHIASASVATRARMCELAVANLVAGLAGQRMPACANPEVYGMPPTAPVEAEQRIVRVLLETEAAHAAAAADDPEWALWYADHALESLRTELGGWLDRPRLVTLLLDAARSYRLDSPAEPWARHYAHRLVAAASRP